MGGQEGHGETGQRDLIMARTVLQNAKQFLGLTGVSLFPPSQDLEDADSRVE